MKKPSPAALRWVAAVLRRVARQMDDYRMVQGSEGIREVADWLDHEAGPEEATSCRMS